MLRTVKGSPAQTNAARDAWRQAIAWDPAGPAARETAEDFLPRYPDGALSAALRAVPAKQPQRVPVPGEEEQGAAYEALSNGRLDEASQKFNDLLGIPVQRARAQMGLGFAAMQRGEFSRAIAAYTEARESGLHTNELTEALGETQFWEDMQRGEAALRAGNTAALRGFAAAPELRPESGAALDATGRATMQAGSPAAATGMFEQAVKADTKQPEFWKDWFAALVSSGRSREARADAGYVPENVELRLAGDPGYLGTMAAATRATGNAEEYSRLVAKMQGTAAGPGRTAAELQLAGSLLTGGSPRDAAREAMEAIKLEPDNLAAWKLLVNAEHVAHRDTVAMTAIERMAAGWG